jgi:hypothetical protein
MTQGLRIPPIDEMAVTPAICARSVSTKRQEGFRHRRKAVRRFIIHPELTVFDHFHPSGTDYGQSHALSSSRYSLSFGIQTP